MKTEKKFYYVYLLDEYTRIPLRTIFKSRYYILAFLFATLVHGLSAEHIIKH